MELLSPDPFRATVEEYLRFESTSTEKHEYRDGRIVNMAGGTFEHSLIIMNLGASLHRLLRGGECRVLESNIRVRIPRTPRYVYADLSVICGMPQSDPEDPERTTVMNPRLIVEVLSPSTEAYDRGEKFDRYRELDSLEEYVLIAQRAARIDTFFRQPDGAWLFCAASGLEAVATLRSLNVKLPLSDAYARVEFPIP